MFDIDPRDFASARVPATIDDPTVLSQIEAALRVVRRLNST
jgi:hypothetical protein